MNEPRPFMATEPHPFLPSAIAITTNDAVSVAFEIPALGKVLQTSGSAKRHPKDAPDDLVGLALATARAMRTAAEQLEAAAYDVIHLREAQDHQARDLHDLDVALMRALDKAFPEGPTEKDEGEEWAEAYPDDVVSAWDVIEPYLKGRAKNGVKTWMLGMKISDVESLTDEELSELPGVGAPTLRSIREAIFDFHGE